MWLFWSQCFSKGTHLDDFLQLIVIQDQFTDLCFLHMRGPFVALTAVAFPTLEHVRLPATHSL